jgi:hypothetical protein
MKRTKRTRMTLRSCGSLTKTTEPIESPRPGIVGAHLGGDL